MAQQTSKLYEKDAYQKNFSASVLSCEACADGYIAALDQTAFYPEGGGQPADHGTLGPARVTDVRKRDGVILHSVTAPLPVGERVEGTIDWERRRLLMQHHSGEHIVSGLVHKAFGYDNVGFHMTTEGVSIDFNGKLTGDELTRIERMANEAVWEDREILISYPSPGALQALSYRSKKELSGEVRIVTAPGCDVCACCGTHVRRTGEIGLIKLLNLQNYKGGVRFTVLCGARALEDYRAKNQSVTEIAGLFSTKAGRVREAVAKLREENDSLKRGIVSSEDALFRHLARELTADEKETALAFEDGMRPDALRRFALALSEGCAVAAVFSAGAQGFQYALASKREDMRSLSKALNQSLFGRGGGARELAQGSVTADKASIEAFFRDLA